MTGRRAGRRQLEIRLPNPDAFARSAGGDAVSIAIPIRAETDAPVALIARKIVERDGRRRVEHETALRRVDGALFAPIDVVVSKTQPDVPEAARSASQLDLDWRHTGTDVAALTGFADWMLATGRDGMGTANPFLRTRIGGMARSVDRDLARAAFLLGPAPSEEMKRSAREDFAIIDGRLHRRVGDPVLVTDRPPGCHALIFPSIPALDALTRFRFDRKEAAQQYEHLADRRRHQVDAVWSFEVETRRGYVPTRDDVRMAVLDAGTKMLAVAYRAVKTAAQRGTPTSFLVEWRMLRIAVTTCAGGGAMAPCWESTFRIAAAVPDVDPTSGGSATTVADMLRRRLAVEELDALP